MLVSNSKTPFAEGYILDYDKFPFVLQYLCTWNKNFQNILDKGNHDASDMQGPGYLISEEGELYMDNIFDYDSWEYCDSNLIGNERLLKATSSLMKDKIGIDLFLIAYKYIKLQEECKKTDNFTYEGLKLAGFSDEDITKMNNTN